MIRIPDAYQIDIYITVADSEFPEKRAKGIVPLVICKETVEKNKQETCEILSQNIANKLVKVFEKMEEQ